MRCHRLAVCLATIVCALSASHADDWKIDPSVTDCLPDHEATVSAWVFFTDKNVDDVAAACAALETTYNPRAIDRRRARRTAPALFDERDLAVSADYVTAVLSSGATERIRSRWMNAVTVDARMGQLRQIARLPFVTKIQRVRTTSVDTLTATPDATPPEGFYGPSHTQLTQLNLVALHNLGYTGDGVIVGVLDTGFSLTHDAYNHPLHPLNVVAEWDFVDNDGNTGIEPGDAASQHNHGTWILGTIAAYSPGLLVGGAYDAGVVLAKVEDVVSEYLAEEDFFVAGLELIEAEGGDVATSSVIIRDFYTGDDLDGMTTVMTLGFNAATDNGVHCFQGAGNEGHDNDPATGNLLGPADGYLVNTIGAVDVNNVIAAFSSDGPTADGRLKPELLARGVNTHTVSTNNDSITTTVSGTSLSTPLAAAACACLVQAHPEWTVQQMRHALCATADDYLANAEPDPLLIRGYGLIDVIAALNTSPVTSDLDGDFDTDIEDLLILLAQWGPCTGPCFADFDRDGTIGVTDLLILLAEY